MSPHTVEKNKI